MVVHIVAFDIPYPPTYGGVIDVFFKLVALKEAGVGIILHAFEYHREPAKELEDLCVEVNYYPRKPIFKSLPVRYPHIVKSRASQRLLARLVEDTHPILFEGLHTTYFLSHESLKDRTKLVRMHNIEWEYYFQLSQRESRYWYKQYYQAESRQLQFWEDTLPFADQILTISPKDTAYYQAKFKNIHHLPPFHAHNKLSCKTGTGEYCLYHGNLGVVENHEAAMFLVMEVFAALEYPLILAGSDPLPELIEVVNTFDHIVLRPNPGQAEMMDLLHHAHIHVLPTFQSTGIKLKLINSLYTGRWVLVNPHMINQTGLEFSTIVAHSPEEWQENIDKLAKQAFTDIEIAQRTANLSETYSNSDNARELMALIENLEYNGPRGHLMDGEDAVQ
ncbi:MAG: hypothetical protein AAF587_18220 [Bacteroidota bacterium]